VSFLERVAGDARAERVTAVRVRLGALSHFTPEHFREHFDHAARGTVAEGAAVEAVVDTSHTSSSACGVRVESVEVDGAVREARD